MPEKKKIHTDQELADIAIDLLCSLKPMRLTVRELHEIVQHMEKAIGYITYGPIAE